MFNVHQLVTDADWNAFAGLLLKGQANSSIVPTLVRQLKYLGARSALIELDYLDRDFSEAFYAYYARTFRRHSKLCTRILLFTGSIDFLRAKDPDVHGSIRRLEAAGYVGSIVLRPISQAPVAQILLPTPTAPAGFDSGPLVRSRYEAHVLGATLSVDAIPMTQQDSRIGACAQAAIWVACRHFNNEHNGPWLSIVAITEAAITNPQNAVNTALPAGSEGLTGDNMVAGLRAGGREPLIYAAQAASGVLTWSPHLRPIEIIDRYIDSGIPVIVGLQLPQQTVGHAVVATGHITQRQPRITGLARPTVSEFCVGFYVNDDQVGANVIMPVDAASGIGETRYSMSEVAYLMVPLPAKVYLPAEKAEALSWDALTSYANDWPRLKAVRDIGTSGRLGDELIANIASNKVLARTYLTHGWRYRSRALRNRLTNPVHQLLQALDLPRFVYVTEFSLFDDVAGKSAVEKRVVAHSVVDATAKNSGLESVLFFHAPGFCSWRKHDASHDLKLAVASVVDSERYFPKVRGEDDFSSFETDDTKLNQA